jgi:hypothetical protein
MGRLLEKFGQRIATSRPSMTRIIRWTGLEEEDARELAKLSREKYRTPKEEPAKPEPKAKEPDGGELLLHAKYVYNPQTDTYITFLDQVPKPISLSGPTHREIVRAYSNFDGNPASLNEIARSVGMPRPWLIKYLRAHEITHDREPFTPEELMSRSDDDLIQDSLQLRRAAVYKALEKAKWQEIQRDATKWRNWEDHTLRAIITRLGDRASSEPPTLDINQAAAPFACVFGLTDFHWGKYSDAQENGEAYSREQARSILFDCVSDVMSRVATYGAPEKIYIPVGSDFFHVDNSEGKTTSGTPQDIDGTPAEILVSGCHLMEDLITSLITIAPVELVLMSGNHDRMLGVSLLLYLEAVFRGNSRVTANLDRTHRIYKTYGKNLIGFVHSDGVKKTVDLAGHMAREASDVWGACPHRTIYTGHLHFEKTETDTAFSVVRRQIPSLSTTDRWHSLNGFIGSPRSLPVYLHDKEKGLVAIFHAPAE